MKRFFFTSKMLSMLLLLTMTFSTVSCDEEDDDNPTETITIIAQRTENLSIFAQALERTGLRTTLGDPTTSYTVFAPTNEAFRVFLQDYNNDINNVPVDPLRHILVNHIVGVETYVANLPNGGYVTTGTVNVPGTYYLSLYVDKSSGIRLNNSARVISRDIRATNGVIHTVDAVIEQPTITTHLRANPALSTLTGLLTRPGQHDFANTLDSPGTYTVFAPINDAFSALDRELPGGMASLDAGNISDVLGYHVVPVRVLSGAIGGQTLPTSLIVPTPQTLTVSANGLQITDARNRQTNIGTTDILATNGVIHAVNRVLLPNLE